MKLLGFALKRLLVQVVFFYVLYWIWKRLDFSDTAVILLGISWILATLTVSYEE